MKKDEKSSRNMEYGVFVLEYIFIQRAQYSISLVKNTSKLQKRYVKSMFSGGKNIHGKYI